MSNFQERQDRFITYLSRSGKTKETGNIYRNLVKNYFRFWDNPEVEVSEERIAFFLNALKESKYAAGYIGSTKYALKAYCAANQIPWQEGTYLFPIKSRDDERVFQPAFSLDQVGKLIRAVKKEEVTKGYLFLISLYGLRQNEAIKVKEEDIDFNKKTIFIKTSKGGEKREHLLPDIAKKFIDIDFKAKSHVDMKYHFGYICKLAGVEIKKGYGWHAIRRSLVTELFNLGHRSDQIEIFLRWSNKSRMVNRYNVPDLLRLDREILGNHPFLKFWEE